VIPQRNEELIQLIVIPHVKNATCLAIFYITQDFKLNLADTIMRCLLCETKWTQLKTLSFSSYSHLCLFKPSTASAAVDFHLFIFSSSYYIHSSATVIYTCSLTAFL